MYRSRLAFALATAAMAAILTPSTLTAQGAFKRTYGGVHKDIGYSVQQTADGGYVIAGNSMSFGAGSEDVYIIKTDAAGNAQWTRAYGGPSYDGGRSVQQTTDEGYIVVGYTASFGSGSLDVYLIKTDANGDTIWTRTYGGPGEDDGSSVRQTADGGYLIAGTTASSGAGDYDVYLIRTNANGDTLWTRTIGGASTDAASAIQATSDSGYIVVGFSNSFGALDYDVYLILSLIHI